MARDVIDEGAGLSPGAVYTLQEACRFLRISEATARRWLKQGRLRGRKVGRGYRFLGSDLVRCLTPTAEPELELRPSYPGHPLLALAGIGDSGRSDISEEHDRYLAEFARGEA